MDARAAGIVVGVISDTHGLLRPEAEAALAGCHLILHAGDVGAPAVLAGLERLAPVRAVRGNVDRGAWAEVLPEVALVEVSGLRIALVHDLATLGDAGGPAVRAVVFGHSHRPLVERRDGRLYLNPGSAGPRRFRLPISVARLRVAAGEVSGELVMLG